MQEYAKRTEQQTHKDISRDKVGANIAIYVSQKMQQLLAQKLSRPKA